MQPFALAGHGIEGQRQGFVELADELAPVDGAGVLRPRTANEDDRRS